MLNSKYNRILNIVLIISAVVIIGLLGFWGYQIYKKYYVNKNANQAVDEFIDDVEVKEENEIGNVTLNINELDIENIDSNNRKLAKKTYKGFTMDGVLEIPKINIRYPILDRATEASMDVAVGINFTTSGLNKTGNTVIMGHNSGNGLFFANLDKLVNGDPIYVTDNDGVRVKYVIYNMYQTSAEDLDYFTRDTAGKREISLSTCLTNDTSNRLVIWAKEEE